MTTATTATAARTAAEIADRRARIAAARHAVMNSPEGLRFKAIDAEYGRVLHAQKRVANDARYTAAYDRHTARLRELSVEYTAADAAFMPLYEAYVAHARDIAEGRA